MNITAYRSRVVDIEAAQWDGTVESAEDIVAWIQVSGGVAAYRPERTTDTSYDADDNEIVHVRETPVPAHIAIETIDPAVAKAFAGDHVIHGTAGEFYPCKPEILEAKYEALAEFATFELADGTIVGDGTSIVTLNEDGSAEFEGKTYTPAPGAAALKQAGKA